MTLYARLSNRNRTRVVCGACPAELARVMEGRSGKRVERWLVFPPGWTAAFDDRVLERPKRGKPRKPTDRVPLGAMAWRIWELPQEARCPECRSRQTLEAERLQVDARDSALSEEVPTPCPTPGCRGRTVYGQQCTCGRVNKTRPPPGELVDWREIEPNLL